MLALLMHGTRPAFNVLTINQKQKPARKALAKASTLNLKEG
jgi:hypothetical protein